MDQPIIVAAMTGAEMRTTREYLGLSTNWLARWLNVGQRKIFRWEADELTIPNGVVGQLDDLYDEAAAIVELWVAWLRPQMPAKLVTWRTDEDYWQAVPPTGADRYPAQWHRAICARIIDQLPGIQLVYE